MSYILDALKKSQAEQNPDSLGLNLSPPPPQAKRSPWLVIAAAALCANLLFFSWYFLNSTNQSAQTLATIDAPASPQTSGSAQANQPSQGPVAPATTSQSAQSVRQQPTRSPENTSQPPAQVPPPSSRPLPVRTPTAPRTARSAPVQQVALSALSQSEQTLYAGFSYTSHIFTEDADLRAVVIDGQRLQSGDAFKGLKVVEITETGVIFAESRRGKTRHVVVNPFE